MQIRIYTVGMDGHIIGSEPVICDDDSQAIEKAKQFLDGHDLQIWSGPRYVQRLVNKDKYGLGAVP